MGGRGFNHAYIQGFKQSSISPFISAYFLTPPVSLHWPLFLPPRDRFPLQFFQDSHPSCCIPPNLKAFPSSFKWLNWLESHIHIWDFHFGQGDMVPWLTLSEPMPSPMTRRRVDWDGAGSANSQPRSLGLKFQLCHLESDLSKWLNFCASVSLSVEIIIVLASQGCHED